MNDMIKYVCAKCRNNYTLPVNQVVYCPYCHEDEAKFVLDAPERTVVYTYREGDIDIDTGKIIHLIEETDYLEEDDE